MRWRDATHVLGSPSAFHPWKSLLPSDTSLISVWYPGRNRKATGECSDARELVRAPLNPLPSFEPQLTLQAVAIALAVESYLGGVSVPYALYGHSFGCLLSFLVINELNRRSVRLPAMYVAAAGRPPCVMEGLAQPTRGVFASLHATGLGSQPPIRNYTVAQMKQVMEGYGHTPGAQRHWCGNPSGSHWIDEILNNEAMLDFFSKPVKVLGSIHTLCALFARLTSHRRT